MESYIVRVYRRDEKDPERLIGIVEEIGGKKKTFHKMGELSSIILGISPDFSGAIQKERRMSERLRLNLPVRLKGTNAIGENFIEDTSLNNLSSCGAYLYVRNLVSKDTGLNLLIDPDHTNLNIDAKVVRLEDGNDRNGVGVFFSDRI